MLIDCYSTELRCNKLINSLSPVVSTVDLAAKSNLLVNSCSTYLKKKLNFCTIVTQQVDPVDSTKVEQQLVKIGLLSPSINSKDDQQLNNLCYRNSTCCSTFEQEWVGGSRITCYSTLDQLS